MFYLFLCFAVFAAAYLINMTYITVFYHRGLTHGAVRMQPAVKKFVIATGNWLTGLDPKGWTCMHRLHHRHSDTPMDPHSPKFGGVYGLLLVQLHSYKKVLRGLHKRQLPYTSVVRDLDFDVSWLNRRHLWYMPYVVHGAIGLAIGLLGFWLLGAAYFLGMMSHPVQGWLVNSFGHSSGYRNFATHDLSRNNTLVAWFVMGEGYQNNHHKSPQSAKFSYRWFEFDMGYMICRVLEAVGLITILRHQIDAEADGVEAYYFAEAAAAK